MLQIYTVAEKLQLRAVVIMNYFSNFSFYQKL